MVLWCLFLQFDHLEFPGVVPRTFIGAVWVSGIAAPLLYVAECWDWDKMASQYIGMGSCRVGEREVLPVYFEGVLSR